jgi:hypothetical protein
VRLSKGRRGLGSTATKDDVQQHYDWGVELAVLLCRLCDSDPIARLPRGDLS